MIYLRTHGHDAIDETALSLLPVPGALFKSSDWPMLNYHAGLTQGVNIDIISERLRVKTMRCTGSIFTYFLCRKTMHHDLNKLNSLPMRHLIETPKSLDGTQSSWWPSRESAGGEGSVRDGNGASNVLRRSPPASRAGLASWS